VDAIILTKINANDYLVKALSSFLHKAESVAEIGVNMNPTMEGTYLTNS
jgi:hypothetical protein